ncbi:MAG: type IV secretion system DNA-binding domain-containing protein [Alphaproteobacteria bacterium]|nr:type IV secretion system DNA-binding domain-containing protein [Alphaproteobacteria bacterium]
MSMMKTFTRGGQVTLHNLHMIRQVLVVTIITSLLIGILFFGTKSWFDYTPYERSAAWAYYWAEFKISIPFVKAHKLTQYYTNPDGTQRIVRSIDIHKDRRHQIHAKNVKQQIIDNAWLSLRVTFWVFVIVCGIWLWRGHSTARKRILSGTEVVSAKMLKKLIRNRKEASDLTLAGVPLIKDKEKQHTLIIGTTGSGKTNCIHELLQQIRVKKQRAIIVDMTGAFIEKYYRPEKDIILNPQDARSKPWHVWGDCPKSHHIRLIASVLIPSDNKGNESYWTKASRVVFMATAEKLLALNRLNNTEFLRYATNGPIREIESFYSDTQAAAIVNSDAAETVMGVRSNLQAHTECITFFKETDRSFSIREWVQDEKNEGWLFLSSPPQLREEIAPLMTLWTSIATDALMGLPHSQERRLWIVVDELPAIKKLPKLQMMLAEIRKYGGCAILGAQDMSQLDEIYGHNIVKSIANLCSTKVVFRIEGAEIAERMSKWLGVQEVSETMENISYGAHQMRDGVSLNDQRKEKPTIHSDRLMKLPDLQAYLKFPGDYPIAKVEFKIHKLDGVAEGLVEIGTSYE